MNDRPRTAGAASDPHHGGRVAHGGPGLSRARLVVVAAHGRGAAPEDMIALVEHLAIVDVAVRAPAAAGRSWWPNSFLAPLSANEPALTSALAAFDATVQAVRAEGVAAEAIVLLGFSQGGCLALEHAARTGRPYRAVVGLSAALVGTGEAGGPPLEALYGNTAKSFDYPAAAASGPVFLACHGEDPHIPMARVRESAAVFEAQGRSVTQDITPGSGHAVTAREISYLRALLNA